MNYAFGVAFALDTLILYYFDLDYSMERFFFSSRREIGNKVHVWMVLFNFFLRNMEIVCR